MEMRFWSKTETDSNCSKKLFCQNAKGKYHFLVTERDSTPCHVGHQSRHSSFSATPFFHSQSRHFLFSVTPFFILSHAIFSCVPRDFTPHFVGPSICLSVHPSVCPSIRLSVYPALFILNHTIFHPQSYHLYHPLLCSFPRGAKIRCKISKIAIVSLRSTCQI